MTSPLRAGLGVLSCLGRGAWLTLRHVVLRGLVAPAEARVFYYAHVAPAVGAMTLHHDVEEDRLAVVETDGSELLGDDRVTVALFGGNGSRFTVSMTELVFLCAAVQRLRPRRILEFGTYLGNTTLHLAANSAADACVYTIDLPPAWTSPVALPLSDNDRLVIAETSAGLGARFRGTPWEAKITQILCDSARYDYRQLGEGFDFIFVDGAHTEKYVRNDSEAALRLVRPGGVVFWHDYVSPLEFRDVFRCLNDLGRRHRLHHVRGTRLVYHLADWR